MKKFPINWILFIILPIAVLSCKKLLDKPFQNGSSDEEMWRDLPLIETYVDSIYHDVLGFPFAIIRLSDFSDESLFPPDWGTYDFNLGDISPDYLPGWSPAASSTSSFQI
jgi:hypothetical protein